MMTNGTQKTTESLATILNMPAEHAARRLLGSILERMLNGRHIRVKIVETEAYDQTDAASHSYRGRTPRTDVMFGPAGHLYVYFTYGMHYCCNIVTGQEGEGSAVLIRAVEPLDGEEFLEENRGGKTGIDLTNGPAKLCQALKITKEMNGHNLEEGSLRLIMQPEVTPQEVIVAKRIGIKHAVDMPWRFYLSDNRYVSRY
jgi:DNA-3-methyladenine glycosylase